MIDRASYLRTVLSYIEGTKLLYAADKTGMLADPNAIPAELNRASSTLKTVLEDMDASDPPR